MNENLLVKRCEEVLVTVPDNICTYFADNGLPVTNSELSPGMRIGIAVVPAPEEWHMYEGGYGMYGDMLKAFDYTGDAIRCKKYTMNA